VSLWWQSSPAKHADHAGNNLDIVGPEQTADPNTMKPVMKLR
jgi:hypothetical protein